MPERSTQEPVPQSPPRIANDFDNKVSISANETFEREEQEIPIPFDEDEC